MVNEYFNCIQLIRRSFRTFAAQCALKSVSLIGPVFANPLDKFYFEQLYGDERRYRQFIINFLSNAIKFSNTNGTVSVHLSVNEVIDAKRTQEEYKLEQEENKSDGSAFILEEEAPDKEILSENELEDEQQNFKEKIVSFQIIFRDNGCGISPENKKRLFMNFGKLHETQNANKDGVGLGLSINKDIINS